MSQPAWIPDLTTLGLLVAVAELGSLNRAAEAHAMSQPSASARLAHMERRTGVTLLVRTTRGTQLTPAGEAVAAWSRTVLDAGRALCDGIESLQRARAARLRIAASLTVAEFLMPAWLLGLRHRHPDVVASVTVANSQSVHEHVRDGDVDLGFVESPDAPARLSSTVVGHDRIALVVAADYPLGRRGARPVAISDIVDQPILLREPGSGTRETFLAALGRPHLRHATELGSTATIVATAIAGGGVGVVSSRAVAGLIAAGALVELNLPDVRLERPLRAVWTGRWPAELARELIDLARSAG